MHVANAVIDPKTGATLSLKQLLRGNNKMTWKESHSDEWGRLTQGNGQVKGTGNCFFVEWKTNPKHITPTYLRPVCDIHPQKGNMHRIRINVDGNKVVTEGDLSTTTDNLTTAKLHVNSTISNDGAKYACFDISNFYLETPMTQNQYMYANEHLDNIPDDTIEQYKLTMIADKKGYVLIEIRSGMYGLPIAVKIAHELLISHLKTYGYSPCRLTPGLWTHNSRPISFTLCVDNFGIKYVGKEHAEHLLQALRTRYSVTTD